MKKALLIKCTLASLLVASCTDDDSFESTSKINDDNIVILQKRNPKLPKYARTCPVVIKKGQTRSAGENGTIICNSDEYLGYSYSVGNSILGDLNNTGSPIIDLSKVKEYGNGYITRKSLQYYTSDHYSYANEDYYESKLSETKKVAVGFSLNVGLFKIGRKRMTEKTFGSHYINNNKAVFGELTMAYYNSSFNIQTSAGSRKLYARDCLSTEFMRNLYSSPIGDLLDTYGDYVLTGYVTGGKAFALFAGETKNSSSSSFMMKNMNDSIAASYSWKSEKNSVSGECKFGKGNSKSDSTHVDSFNLFTRLWIYGGTQSGQTMSSAQRLNDVSIDLGPWVSSLSDSKKHTCIDIAQNGLYPMSAFVLEENFKTRFDDTSLGILPKNPYFVTPYIEIVRVFERYSSSGTALYDIAAVLNTRQGDKIILKTGDAENATDAELLRNEQASVFAEKAKAIKNQKKNYYDLEIRSNSATRLNPNMGKPLCFVFNQFDESRMRTYTNPKTGMQYVYDTKKKVAFCHFTDDIDGDWILDEYGIRDWVESLPTKTIAMATLANSYRIIGL